MASVYLLEQGAKILKESRRIVVQKDGRTLFEFPDFKVERILVFGNVQITTQAMKFLLESGIETALFTTHGRLIGRLQPVESKNIYLRMAQYERFKDEDFKVEIAKSIVGGKIKNCKVLLERFARNHPEVNFDEAVGNLDSCLEELGRKKGLSAVIGIEGRASAVYFQAFGKMLRKGLVFESRTRHPPQDPVNSLLSLGYTLITNEIFSLASGIGFDPYIGYLHGLEYGRPSLALDLVEEFRTPVVDRLTLELVNKEILKEDDFETREGAFYLKEDARRKYFAHYEKRMQTCLLDYETKEEINFRKQFYLQLQKFARSLQEKVPYVPFLMR